MCATLLFSPMKVSQRIILTYCASEFPKFWFFPKKVSKMMIFDILQKGGGNWANPKIRQQNA